MNTFLWLLILFLFSSDDTGQKTELAQRHTFASPHMGSLFRIVLYHHDEEIASAAADSAFSTVEYLNGLLSDYIPDSELNTLTESAGNGTETGVSDPLFAVLSKAHVVSRETDGAFDITIGPLVRLWRSVRNSPEPKLPDPYELEKATQKVNYRYVHLNPENQQVHISQRGVRLDAGGIGKGFAACQIGQVLESFGINSYFINAGGDLFTGQPPPGEKGWRIAINAHNEHGEADPFLIYLDRLALSTSGDLYQFIELDGIRYSHIIDPATGMALTDQRTVTVIGPDATITDAYSTALSVMESTEAVSFINRKPGYHMYMEIFQNNRVEFYSSDDLDSLLISN